MKKIILITCLSLIGASAFAEEGSFHGDWLTKETGTMTLTQNEQVQGTVACHDIHFSINEKDGVLAINDGYLWCGYAYELTLWTYDFTVEDGKIMSRGKAIGTYAADRIFIREAEENNFLEIEIKKHVEEGGLFGYGYKTLDFKLRTFDGLTLVEIETPIGRKF